MGCPVLCCFNQKSRRQNIHLTKKGFRQVICIYTFINMYTVYIYPYVHPRNGQRVITMSYWVTFQLHLEDPSYIATGVIHSNRNSSIQFDDLTIENLHGLRGFPSFLDYVWWHQRVRYRFSQPLAMAGSCPRPNGGPRFPALQNSRRLCQWKIWIWFMVI